MLQSGVSTPAQTTTSLRGPGPRFRMRHRDASRLGPCLRRDDGLKVSGDAWFNGIATVSTHYQMITRSFGARYILSPSFSLNAS
jgi:hypothetical protein